MAVMAPHILEEPLHYPGTDQETGTHMLLLPAAGDMSVPVNMAMSIGYTNASWTLKCDLTCEYVCRLLNHMDAHGYTTCTPRRDADVKPEPLLDFTSGYVLRSVDELPKQGTKRPWKLHQNYLLDMLTLRYGRVADGVMEFSTL